jgi:hypothetical protein
MAAQSEATADPSTAPAGQPAKKRTSMHDGIAAWCDCCSCEAEPYWVEVAEELGIDLGSDYEDASQAPQER